MRKSLFVSFALFVCLCLVGCSSTVDTNESLELIKKEKFSVGVIFPDVGMGDQSFNDLVVDGLVDAREELDIIWSYRDQTTSSTLEQGIDELIAEGHDVILGVGYTIQPLFEQRAQAHPDQRFALIDTVSDVENIDSIVFNEKQGSYLAGVLAANLSTTNVIGFLGGMEDDVILRFRDGFVAGAQSVNADIRVLEQFAGTYSDATLGASIAVNMATQQADVLYAAAGYTGVGLLQQAQKNGIYAIGVDNDQYFYAEKAVVTSVLKNVDIAVYGYVQTLIEQPTSGQQVLEFGAENNGVGLAPIRVVSNATALEQVLEQTTVPAAMN